MNIDTIICGDNVEVLSGFPDECIDLTVTSPPYDKLRKYNGFKWDFEKVAGQLFRVTKKGGVIVWVVGDSTIKGSETGTSFEQALFFKKLGFNLHDTMIYQKSGFPFPEHTRYYQSFEYMFVFSKGKPRTINLINDRKNTYSGEKVARKHGNRAASGIVVENSAHKIAKDRTVKEFGVRFNIWKFQSSSSVGDKVALKHPATFPEQLANDHILSWSSVGDIVLDPFVGSGTTCKTAKILGRHFIGIDVSQEYCDLAKLRIDSVNP